MINDLITAIDKVLPQTQCEECGFKGCKPYAQALAAGSAPIDRCPPGGITTLTALGDLLNIDSTPYLTTMAAKTRPAAIAVIREAECIGCTKCIQACPVDAIIGAAKSMHVIIANECTGCGLCIEPCPVDCIDLVAQNRPSYTPNLARRRHQARLVRLLRLQLAEQKRFRAKKNLATKSDETKAKQDYILQALERVKAKKHE